MKRVLIPLLGTIALLSGCERVSVRHSVEMPVEVVDSRHVDETRVVVHHHDGPQHYRNRHTHDLPLYVSGARHSTVNHREVTVYNDRPEYGYRDHRGYNSTRVVVTPPPVINHQSVTINTGGHDGHGKHSRHREYQSAHVVVRPVTVINKKRVVVRSGEGDGHGARHDKRGHKPGRVVITPVAGMNKPRVIRATKGDQADEDSAHRPHGRYASRTDKPQHQRSGSSNKADRYASNQAKPAHDSRDKKRVRKGAVPATARVKVKKSRSVAVKPANKSRPVKVARVKAEKPARSKRDEGKGKSKVKQKEKEKGKKRYGY